MLPCLVNVRRCPLATPSSSRRQLCAFSASAFGYAPPAYHPEYGEGSDFSSFNFELSTVNLLAVTPFPATLTSHVKDKPFVCHSYKKHRGWGRELRFFGRNAGKRVHPACSWGTKGRGPEKEHCEEVFASPPLLTTHYPPFPTHHSPTISAAPVRLQQWMDKP
jgi:hypothetical protein